MFGKLRDPNGRPTLLMAGIALLMLAWVPFVAPLGAVSTLLGVGIGLAGVACVAVWWRRQQAARYDLSRLWDEAPPSEDEPFEDTLPERDPGLPYCGWCNEAYPPDTYRCSCCGRQLT